jgi:methylmalonyl-CoA mutase N-terminal domain/subunit
MGGGSLREGVLVGVEQGWFQREIADSAYDMERKLNRGEHLVVGLNVALEGNDEAPPEILRIGAEVEELQRKRLDTVKSDRDGDAVGRALAEVGAVAARPDVNVMPALVDAVTVYATVGEICDALAAEFGRYIETPVI